MKKDLKFLMEKAKFKSRKIQYALLPFLLAVWILVKLGDFGINSFLFLISPFKALKKVHFNFTLPKPEFKWEIKKKKTKKVKKVFVLKAENFFAKFFPKRVRVSFFLLLISLGIIFYTYFVLEISSNLPSPVNLKTLPTPTTTEFYDRNGTLLYRFYEGKNRTPVKLSDIPPTLKFATIAMEDKNFYKHWGVDIEGLARVALIFVRDGEVQGGSTITQQLIKNTLLTPERTVQRKTKEIILAFWTEKVFKKDEILEMYFNEVPYGGTAWGVAAAAQTYFDKDVKDLTLAESAFLAGLPASPTTYSPYGTNPELAKLRQKEALRRMVEEGYITESRANEAYAEELKIKSPVNEIKAPHFVLYVRSKLTEKYGERYVSQGGLRVYTTLDLRLQEMAEKIVESEVEKVKNLKVSNGAAMITDAKTGQILAMVGSKNYWDPNGGNFNVTTALRQPGSSIKPITYAAAFKQGYSPGNTLLDTPITFKNIWETYTPVNYDGRFHGAVTIRTALGSSYNIPAVKVLAVIGLPEMLKTAKDLGITTFSDANRYGLSLTLGGGDVKMIDMMSAYGTFSQMGKKNPVSETLKITDVNGNVIEDNSIPKSETVLQPEVAFLITDILADNKARTPAFGSNSLLNFPGFTVAAKTGTTDNKRDNWTFGYTPDYVVGVWVGNNDNSPMDPKLTSGVTGAAPIWNKIMAELLKGSEPAAFQKPETIISTTIDGRRDLAISGKPQKSLVGRKKEIVKTEIIEDLPAGRQEHKTEEKEVITFTDPFSTYQSDQSGQVVIVP